MNQETIAQVYAAIQSGDERLRLRVERAAIRFTSIPGEWWFMTPPERQDLEKQRTSAHNALIHTLNILSKSMAKEGLDNEWRDILGDDRKNIGDFAGFLVEQLRKSRQPAPPEEEIDINVSRPAPTH
jgi:hypothetical protein